MQFSVVSALLSLATLASAAAIPAVEPETAIRQGPLSFMVFSQDAKFNGKWLAPSDNTASGRTTATLSEKRFRKFFLTETRELQFQSTPKTAEDKAITHAAKINDYIQMIPNLAAVTFEQKNINAEQEGGFNTVEKSFGSKNGLTVRGGKQWYACSDEKGAVSVKVLVSGEKPLKDAKCSKITLGAVDGIAKL